MTWPSVILAVTALATALRRQEGRNAVDNDFTAKLTSEAQSESESFEA